MPSSESPRTPERGGGEPAAGDGVSRRGALRTGGLGVLTIVVAGTGVLAYRGFDDDLLDPAHGDAFEPWRHWRKDRGPRGIVAAATLAANPHNTQPWTFRVHDGRIDLHADPGRRLGALDPDGREMHVGLGCALENLALAARARGYSPQAALLPAASRPDLVARVTLTPGNEQTSRLYDAIGDRHTNRGPYHDKAVPDEILAAVAALHEAEASMVWFTEHAAKQRLGMMLIDAAEAIVHDEEQSRDGFAWFRSSADAIARHRDGLTLDGQGLSTVMTAAAKLLPATSRSAGDRFWADQTRTVHTRTAAAYGMILVPDPGEPAQRLAGGRLLQRIHLTLTAHGLAMQPMNQITERIDRDRGQGRTSRFEPALAALLARPGRQTLATFRAGFAVRSARCSPRRPVTEVTR